MVRIGETGSLSSGQKPALLRTRACRVDGGTGGGHTGGLRLVGFGLGWIHRSRGLVDARLDRRRSTWDLGDIAGHVLSPIRERGR